MRASQHDKPVTLQTGLSLALVLLLIGAAVTYGRQSQRLDAIESEVRESRSEVRESRAEVRSLRDELQRLLREFTPARRIP